jgi:hypothetical protein
MVFPLAVTSQLMLRFYWPSPCCTVDPVFLMDVTIQLIYVFLLAVTIQLINVFLLAVTIQLINVFLLAITIQFISLFLWIGFRCF